MASRPRFPTRRPGTARPAALRAGAVLAAAMVAAAGLAAVAGSAPADAQPASGPAATGGPVQIEADSVDIRPQDNLILLTGNAVVIQDGAALRSNTLRVVYDGQPGAAGSQVDRVLADTEVFYVTQTERVRGDSALYDARANQITIRGRVIVTQGQSVLEGSELVVNTVTRASRMRGVDGRVRAVFFQEPQPRRSAPARPAGN